MKINTPASRDAIRARYGSVRKFAALCVREYGIPSLDSAYSLVGKALRNERSGRFSGPIVERLRSEGVLVEEAEPEPSTSAE